MKNAREFIRESPRDIPVVDEVDVCVVGGSCTGVFAAVRAAEAGLRVAIVENNGFFGGTATAGLVPVWHSLFDAEGRRPIIRGLTHQVLEHLVANGEAVRNDPADISVYAYLNTAALTVALDALIVRHPSIRPFLHARFVGVVESAPRHPTHAVIEDKSGRRAIAAAFFIDATGDADFLDRAGFETWSLPAAELQPHTTCALLSGVPAVRAAHPDFSITAMLHPRRGAGLKHVFGWTAPVIGAPELTFTAATRIQNCNPADADDLTAGEIEGRRQLWALVRAANREFATEGAAIGVAALAPIMGVRESRHARCLHSLTEDDVLAGQAFDDAVAYGSYRVDVHHDEGITFRYLDGKQQTMRVDRASGEITWDRGRWRPETPESPTFYQIPYRCLVPRGARNVLCAGRMLDCDRGAYGACRVMVNCNQMGEAAGVAAARCVAEGAPIETAWRGLANETLPETDYWHK
ncbi:MAG: FAD-dependent oxidoreductase [Kiritimatiellia bacterium]|jgi:2-polyprenyl-6-methoxyphenol hydroxylase-like FAD-dependent oxidoreductase